MLHLPRRHRRGEGWRREDDGNGRVGGGCRARRDRACSIVEVEGKSGLADDVRGAGPLATTSSTSITGIRARFLTPDAALVDYLESHGMRRISKRLIASGALEVVATAVPGMKDILVLGKVKSLDEARAADLIIVDAPAAGHAISFLLSPRGPARRGAGRPDQQAGVRRRGAALRSRALPGDARDAARGDAGERGDRDRVRDRGPRRRRARPGRS